VVNTDTTMKYWEVYLKSGNVFKVVAPDKATALLTAFELSPNDQPVRAVMSGEW
jgi:hypothetical protein